MSSETLLDKYIRPSTLAWVMALWTGVMLADGNLGEFSVRDIYVEGLNSIVLLMITVYVLGKSAEKIFAPKKKEDNEDA